MTCRKNFIDLNNDERNLLAGAFNDLFARGLINTFADEHEHHFLTGIHRGPAFLPWHRYFLLEVEAEMRRFDSRAIIPYWDWTRADSRDLDVEPWKSFFGGRNNTGGRFDHWSYNRAATPPAGEVLPSLDSVIDEVRRGTYAEFRVMEFGSHVPGHTWTSGTMESTRSPLDPLFYIHHCNVDRLWSIWQRNHAGVAQYTLDECPPGVCSRVQEAFVPLNDPMIGGATPASMLDHLALGYSYPSDDLMEQRVLARGFAPIITGDPAQIELLTPNVNFNDVPEGDTTRRAALFRVSGCERLTFSVGPGPTPPFSLHVPGPFPFPHGPLPQSELRIWVLFTGRAPNTTDFGSLTVVARDEFGVEVARFDILIVANSVRRPRAAVTLVLDESGSMLAQAGNGRTRIQVLRQAATTLVDHLYDDNGLAIVSFADTAARVMDLQVAGPMNSGARSDARNQIALHGPPDVFPHTGIGGGIQEAAQVYATSPIASNFDVQSTVVFTDGIEDRAPFIRDVRSLINERVYAVGVANAANVQNDILRALANDSGGFMLVTGEIPQDDEFLLEKFFIQVLAGVVNRSIVRDPEGVVFPGQIARVPFSLTRSDIEFDALALSRVPQFLAIALQAPDGTVVDQAQVPAGGFRTGATSSSFRITLPLVVNGVEHWEGEWQLLLGLFLRGTGPLTHIPVATDTAALRFHALMHVRSNLNLRASIDQSTLTPGATLHLRASITEYGQPIETHPTVGAQMTRPDGTIGQLGLTEPAHGEFESSVVATQSGVYRFLIQASGRSTRGHAFTREYLLTAVVGHPSHEPPGGGPSNGDGSGDGSDLCDILRCLFGEQVLSDRYLRHLEEKGIDVVRLRKCLEELCRRRGATGR